MLRYFLLMQIEIELKVVMSLFQDTIYVNNLGCSFSAAGVVNCCIYDNGFKPGGKAAELLIVLINTFKCFEKAIVQN